MHLMLLGMGEFLGEDGNRQGVTEVSPQAGQGSPLPPLPGLASTSPILPVALSPTAELPCIPGFLLCPLGLEVPHLS